MNWNAPFSLALFFIVTTILALLLLVRATNRPKPVVYFSVAWLVIQAMVAYSGFYLEFSTLPPHFALAPGPAIIFVIGMFLTQSGRKFIDSLNQESLVWIHTVRIPVELTLYALFIFKLVPEIMTFAGRNFDILAGLSAPFVAYFGIRKKRMGRTGLLVWNFLCLILLFNIVSTAVLSTPFPFQQWGFDQPNIGIFYFPYVWLPCYVVPVVLFSHLAQIRYLLLNK